jgi:hypothetical protein
MRVDQSAEGAVNWPLQPIHIHNKRPIWYKWAFHVCVMFFVHNAFVAY